MNVFVIVIVAMVCVSALSALGMVLRSLSDKDKVSIKGTAEIKNIMKGEVAIDAEDSSKK